MPDLLLDVVLRFEEAEPAAPVRDVVDVVGGLVHELVHLVDERRNEQEPDRDEESEREQRGHSDGAAALGQAVPLEPVDCRVQREREEERDQHPREDVPGDPDHLEDDRHRDDRRQQGEDRPQPEADQALRDHPCSITTASDVFDRARVSNLPP